MLLLVIFMTIENIVISGGGPHGIQFLGSLRHLNEIGFWNIKDIKRIYGTSFGSILGVLLCLNHDWDTIYTYIIDRPWKDAFHITAKQIFEAYSKKGLYDKSFMEIIFKPLFYAKDLTMTITMKELYEFSNIELHIYTLELNSYSVVDLSWKTYPDLSVIDALTMSSALPSFISPVCTETECFIDGGLLNNYPLNNCVSDVGEDKLDTILGFRFLYESDEINPNIINTSSNLLEFAFAVFYNSMRFIANSVKRDIVIPHEIKCKTSGISVQIIQNAMNSSEIRAQMLEDGKTIAEDFIRLYSGTE